MQKEWHQKARLSQHKHSNSLTVHSRRSYITTTNTQLEELQMEEKQLMESTLNLHIPNIKSFRFF